MHSAQMHTDAGHHELRLERWELWAERVGIASTISPNTGRLQLEMAVLAIGGKAALLPWTR